MFDDGEAFDVQQTTDGGYIVAGEIQGDGAWLIKTDSDGNDLWNKTYGTGIADSVQQTIDGGYIIAGYTGHYAGGNFDFDAWLMKSDANGNSLWNKAFDISEFDFADSVQQTTDGGYIIAGYTGPYGNFDALLIKTNATGNTILP